MVTENSSELVECKLVVLADGINGEFSGWMKEIFDQVLGRGNCSVYQS